MKINYSIDCHRTVDGKNKHIQMDIYYIECLSAQLKEVLQLLKKDNSQCWRIELFFKDIDKRIFIYHERYGGYKFVHNEKYSHIGEMHAHLDNLKRCGRRFVGLYSKAKKIIENAESK